MHNRDAELVAVVQFMRNIRKLTFQDFIADYRTRVGDSVLISFYFCFFFVTSVTVGVGTFFSAVVYEQDK